MKTNEELLSEAQAAYHALMTGKMARVYVDANGERLEYNAASALRLAAYIQYLKSLIGQSVISPLRPFF